MIGILKHSKFNMSPYLIFTVYFSVAICDLALGVNLDKFRRSIYRINTISQAANFSQPWLHANQASSSGTGFYVGAKRILTNAHVVANARYITVQRDGDDRPSPAYIKFIAHDADLAILAIDNDAGFDDAVPLRIGGVPKLRGEVATIGFPMGGDQLSITAGVVSRISFRKYAHSGFEKHLLVQVDSAINPGNSGGPVFQGDFVVGVAFQAFNEAENTGYIIPPPVIARFFKDIEDGEYQGHPVMGIETLTDVLNNPATIRYHKLEKLSGGIKVASVATFSPLYESILPGDILLEVNDQVIGFDGKTKYYGERVDFENIYDLLLVGDTVSFKVMRQGSLLSVKNQVTTAKPSRTLGSQYPRFPRFDIFAGLVFTPLSLDYLKVWGSKWFKDAPSQLRYLHWFYQSENRFKNSKDIVVLASRLPDPVNTEAEHSLESVIDKINGIPINSLDEVSDALLSGTSEYIEITLWNEAAPLVVPRLAAQESNDEIIKRYNVFPRRWLGGDKNEN